MSYDMVLKSLDRDGDGQITIDDFVLIAEKCGLGSVGKFALKQVFKAADKDKSGTLDSNEVKRLVEKMIKMGGSIGTMAKNNKDEKDEQ